MRDKNKKIINELEILKSIYQEDFELIQAPRVYQTSSFTIKLNPS